MEKEIVGISENFKKGYCQFQMIFSDGSRTSGKNDQDDDEWMDKIVDPVMLGGLRTVEVKYSKDNSRCVGYNWIDKEDVNLLQTEDWDEQDLGDGDSGYDTITIALEEGAKLIGFRSRQKGDKEGDYDVQFVKGVPK